jgi:hypothetical protein
MRPSTLPATAIESPATQGVPLQRILRAIASSTAIETGQSSQEIERQLQADSEFRWLELAAPTAA